MGGGELDRVDVAVAVERGSAQLLVEEGVVAAVEAAAGGDRVAEEGAVSFMKPSTPRLAVLASTTVSGSSGPNVSSGSCSALSSASTV
jgi:hypothetical protein